MSEVGVHETFLWETQSWSFDHPEVKPPDSGSNAQTPTGKEVAAAAPVLAAAAPVFAAAAPVVAPLPPKGKKRSGGCKSEKGSGGGGSEGKSSGGGGDAAGEADHEVHIWTERERRKKMRNMFSNLHALLPQLSAKADKSTIVDEAVNYIRSLQQELHKLQRRKLERIHGIAGIGYETTIITAPPKLGIDTREGFMADHVSSNNNLGVNQTNTSNNAIMSFSRFMPPAFQTWTSSNVVLNICGDQAQFNICAMRKPGLFTAICYVMEKNKIDVVHASISSDIFRTMYTIQAQARMTPDMQLPETTFQNVVEDIYKQAAAEVMLWVSS